MLDQAIKTLKPDVAEESIKFVDRLSKKISKFKDDEWEFLLAVSLPPSRARRTSKKTKDVATVVNDVKSKLEKLRQIESLKEQFNMIELDQTVKRKFPRPPRAKGWDKETGTQLETYKKRLALYKDPTIDNPGKLKPLETLSIPLVWKTRLPAKPIVQHTVSAGNRKYVIKAPTPRPTPEAIQMIKDHGEKFDRLECWWVPKDLDIVEIAPPPADPVLVGIIEVPSIGTYCFELTRWIDESVETGWWSKEGY